MIAKITDHSSLNGHRPRDAREIARRYIIERGWAVIPILPRSKKAFEDGWGKLRITVDEVDAYFSPHHNIGVILGEPSGNLVDIDLDL